MITMIASLGETRVRNMLSFNTKLKKATTRSFSPFTRKLTTFSQEKAVGFIVMLGWDTNSALIGKLVILWGEWDGCE
jgi:hypothetical protein